MQLLLVLGLPISQLLSPGRLGARRRGRDGLVKLDDILQQALSASGLTNVDITSVEILGGTCRIPPRWSSIGSRRRCASDTSGGSSSKGRARTTSAAAIGSDKDNDSKGEGEHVDGAQAVEAGKVADAVTVYSLLTRTDTMLLLKDGLTAASDIRSAWGIEEE